MDCELSRSALTPRELIAAFDIRKLMSRIWIFHAQVQNKGENPFLSTIFHKITFVLQHPVLPVFVFGQLFVSRSDCN